MSQPAKYVCPVLDKGGSNVADVGSTLIQHRVNISSLLICWTTTPDPMQRRFIGHWSIIKPAFDLTV